MRKPKRFLNLDTTTTNRRTKSYVNIASSTRTSTKFLTNIQKSSLLVHREMRTTQQLDLAAGTQGDVHQRKSVSRDLGHAASRVGVFIRKSHHGRSCANRHDRDGVQHPLADRRQACCGTFIALLPGKCRTKENSTRLAVSGDFIPKKAKNRFLFVMRYSKSTNKKRLRKVREETKALVVQVEEILNILKKSEAFVAADKCFCPNADAYEELEEQVGYLGMPRGMHDLGDAMMRVWQHWRAGIEGTISCLKRAFRLARCCFRGFKNFSSAIGSAVFCHNLTILAKISSG